MQPKILPEVAAHIAAFKLWLERQGCDLLPCAQWELVRWRPATGDGPHMVYTNKKGVVGRFSGSEAQDAWREWLATSEGEQVSAQVYHLPTRPHPEPVQLSSVGPLGPVGAYQVQCYTTTSYVGADIHDKAGSWVANIHGTHTTRASKTRVIATYERNIWLFCHAEKMAQLLAELTGRGVSQADLPRLEHLGREVQEFLKGLPK